MLDILLKLDNERCKFLRASALSIAMKYQDDLIQSRKPGKRNGSIESIMDIRPFTYVFFAYHSKTTVTIEVTSRDFVDPKNDLNDPE